MAEEGRRKGMSQAQRLSDGYICNGQGCDSLEPARWCMSRPEHGKEVLEHIILDMTGKPVTVDNFANPAVHRAFCRKRRLLDRTNTVLISRLALMILFALTLLGATMVTWYYTSSYSNKAVSRAASVLRHEMLKSSLQTMSFILGQSYNYSSTLSSLHQGAFHSGVDRPWESMQEEIRRINWAFFRRGPQLSSVAFLHHEGYAADYARIGDLEYLFFANESSMGVPVAWYMQNVTGSLSGFNKSSPVITATSGPYVINPTVMEKFQQSQSNWSIEPGIRGEPVIAATTPVFIAETKEFVGVSAITTSLKEFKTYLSTVDVLGGFLYVVWRYHNEPSKIIAMSSPMSESDILRDATAASNPLVAAAAQYLQTEYRNSLSANMEVHLENIKLLGTDYYIDTMPLRSSPFNNDSSPFHNLELDAVVAVPRESIMGRIESGKQTVVAVSVGIAIAITVFGCILICFLTSNMSTEMQLRQELITQLVAKQKAELSSNHKSQFLANMSHELRTPMAGIIGLLDLLSCDTLTPEQEASVSQIRRCATGLLSMVNNVLDISKVEAGKMDLDLAPFNLTSELESLVDMFAAQMFSVSVDVALELSDSIPPVMKGDASRIRQIFTNLLSNAMKFTQVGFVIIRGWVDEARGIGLPLEASNQIYLVFEVDDSGCGIPPEMHESVFESFVQADSSYTRIHGGSGLGLCIVRSLVEKMGGEIRVVPKQGPGTLIRFSLVLEKVDKRLAGSILANSPSPDSLGSLVGSPAPVYIASRTPAFNILERTQVLVVMAEGIAAAACTRWFEKQGAKVTHVGHWQHTIAALDSICGTDLRLPVFQRSGYFSDAEYSPFGTSSGCSSRTLEGFLDVGNSPLLAMIDVGLFLSDKTQVPLDFESGNRLPAPLQELINHFSSVRQKLPLAVGWIVQPDFCIALKKTLQDAVPSVILIKPLHASRMKRLLTLLYKVCKLDIASSEPMSCMSSDPSTPRLTPVRETAYQNGSSQHPVHYQSDDYMPSTPGSPTSGLLTPEIVNSVADGIQEVRKEKELENEWSGPVIDLKIPGKASSTPCTAAASPANGNSSAPKALEDLRILVVEDTPVIQAMVSRMLGKLGAHVAVAGDGQQGVDAYIESMKGIAFDLILMDCAMPVMDGYSATRSIRELEAPTGRHTPVVALTAHALTSDEAKCRAAGMDDYLTKPVNYKLMVDTIKKHVKTAGDGSRSV